MMDLLALLKAQRHLQVTAMGGDPMTMEGEERTTFIKDMSYALEDELHELTDEVGWKPWASSRHVNELPALGEGVDMLHFWLNLMLASCPRDWTVEMLAHHLASRYNTKVAENARRQRDGYDGVSGKCVKCKRDLAEVEPIMIHQPELGGSTWSCSCGTPLPEAYRP